MNRRDFLETSALLTAATFAAQIPATSTDPPAKLPGKPVDAFTVSWQLEKKGDFRFDSSTGTMPDWEAADNQYLLFRLRQRAAAADHAAMVDVPFSTAELAKMASLPDDVAREIATLTPGPWFEREHRCFNHQGAFTIDREFISQPQLRT
jgi:hypothetical protein